MKLALGAAQFGLDYGISNRAGQTSAQEVRRILELALHASIDTVDTAYQYGDSEYVLGTLNELTHHFCVITKTCKLQGETNANPTIAILDEAFSKSLERLRLNAVAGLLVHHADDLFTASGDRLYRWLVGLREAGKTARIGVSIYRPEQAMCLLDHFDIDMLQAPLNLMDRRLVMTGLTDRLHARGIELHVRSAFLQGLFFMPPSEIPESLAQARPFVAAIQQRAKDIGVSVGALALGYLRQQCAVNRIVIGVNTVEQLATNLQAYATLIEDSQAFDGLDCDDLSIIDPSTWSVSR